jgi:hypothetical protein
MIFINNRPMTSHASRTRACSAEKKQQLKKQQRLRQQQASANNVHSSSFNTVTETTATSQCAGHARNMPIAELKKEEIQKLMYEKLSIKYVVVHSVFMIVISLLLIILQIVGLVLNLKANYSGGGIWVGVYHILVIVFTLFLGKHYSEFLF